MEEKTGKIINVENATEKQKKQKLGLILEIAAFCTAIGIAGSSIYSQSIKDKNDKEFIRVYQEEILTNDGWEKGNFILTSHEQAPVAPEDEKRIVFLGEHEGNMDTLNVEMKPGYIVVGDKVYIKEDKETIEITNYVYQEEKLVNGEWVKGDMFVTNNTVPQDSADKRYVFIGPSFEKMTENVEDISSGKVR